MEMVPAATRFATNGMVCAIDHLAASAGTDILRRGGSAADAAVATSAVLAVTSQHMCGMGGDLFALVSVADEPVTALNASGRTGSGSDPERLRAEGRRSMPQFGDVRSSPVPGCVDGWLALHDRYGRLPLPVVLESAQRYAEEGFPVSPTLAGAYRAVADLPEAADYRASANAVGVLPPGAVVRRPGVATALAAVSERGRAGFYQGEFGDALLKLGNGEYTDEDLALNQADWVTPISIDAWGHQVWTVPPNSQGYLTLSGAWMAERLPLPDDPDDPLWAHLLIETARQAGQDRPDVLYEGADPSDLLDRTRLAARLQAIRPDQAASLPGTYSDGGTIYLCAVDSDRMGVSLIQSNFTGWGSRVIVPGTRIFLSNRGLGFSLRPGHPAEYGPRRRPPHTLAPALVTDLGTGRLRHLVGTMGGDGQPQVLLQLLARLLKSGQVPAQALAAGRWVLSTGSSLPASPPADFSLGPWGGGNYQVVVEGHAPEAWDEGLRRRGHPVRRVEPYSHAAGHAHIIEVADDHLIGAADPRSLGGDSVGW
jgi:gamma-glutamyltranspeptidase/glutathione hydrolase